MKLSSWYRLSILAALLSVNALCAMGCEGDVDSAAVDDEDVSTSEAALVGLNPIHVWDIDRQTGVEPVINSIKDQAASAGRTKPIERGLEWFWNRSTTYDPYVAFQGFRRDCSGFVSMCWERTDNPSTKAFPPLNTKNPEKYAVLLSGFDEMVPGDAVNRTVYAVTSDGRTTGHIMIFAGWAKPDHSEVYFIHHGGGKGKPVSIIQVRRDRLVEYAPIRSINEPLEPVVPETPGADGCTDTQRNNCAVYTCGCSNGKCFGGACPGADGCTDTQRNDCSAATCGCSNGTCTGGACSANPKGPDGCTDAERNNCSGFACGCSNGQCFGGACPGSDGCTDAERANCNASGTTCTSGKCDAIQSVQPVTLHRLWNSNGDHFYTISSDQVNSAVGQGYELEDQLGVGQCYPAATPETVPLFRLWNPTIGDHFYTTNAAERDIVVQNNGYAYEGIECWVYTTQVASTCPLYRMYSKSMTDHFYTLSPTEVWNAASTGVYVLEDISVAAYIYASPCPQ